MTNPVDPKANNPYSISTPRAALNEEAARTARDIHEIVTTHQNAAPGALLGAGIGGCLGGPLEQAQARF